MKTPSFFIASFDSIDHEREADEISPLEILRPASGRAQNDLARHLFIPPRAG
jgi:hypothetical protein